MLKNTPEQYGLISKLFHWLSALIIISMYIMGKWMEDLDYYSQWYHTAPAWHKSIGICLLLFTCLRLIWRTTTPLPASLSSHSKNVTLMSSIGHKLIYVALFIAMCSGYLISTADGRVIDVFTWFSVPVIGPFIENQEDLAGEIHEQATNAVILLAIIHILAALKHHFIDKDNTLKRML